MLVMNDDLRCMKIIFNWMSRFCFLKQTRQRLFHSYVPVVRATSSLKKRTVLTIRCTTKNQGLVHVGTRPPARGTARADSWRRWSPNGTARISSSAMYPVSEQK